MTLRKQTLNGRLMELSAQVASLQMVGNVEHLGSCGATAYWSLSDTGYLRIYGSGTMTDYTATTMPWYAYISSIKTMVLSGVTSIGKYAFYGCTALTSVNIANTVTSINDRAFSGCTALTSMTIPDSVTTIGINTFYFCTSLTSVTIPDSVTTIGYSAFCACTALTSMTIPDSITAISDRTFYGCTALASVTIPDSVTAIGDSALKNCTALISITFNGDQPTLAANSFSLGIAAIPTSATIYSSGWANATVFTSTIIGSYTTLSYVTV